MKTKINIILLTIFGSVLCVAQTPQEEQAQKMMDSIMQNMPESQRAMMQQMMQKSKEVDAKRKAEKQQAKKDQASKNKMAQKEAEKKFYWRNKIASDTQGKFENWVHGDAEIKVIFSHGGGVLKLGVVSANGQIKMNLPDLDFRKWRRIPITQNAGEGDLMRSSSYELDYSNKNVTYFSTIHNLGVYQGEEMIGTLNIGNSIKPVVNLNAPCCFDKAGDGYMAYWVFMSQANTIVGKNGSVIHDLKFQPGWNLIMVRVEGTKEKSSSGIPGMGFWKNQYYTATANMPADAQFYFTLNK